MLKSVIIFGGGISGLTVAHELLERGYDVTLYEKGDALGGMARSRRENNNIPSEHSWRGYAPFYNNTFELLRRIPLANTDKTVYDNLSTPIEFYLLRDRLYPHKSTLTYLDYLFIGYYSLKFLLSDTRRNAYYKEKAVPLLENKLSNDGLDTMINLLVGPGLGMETKDVSYGHLFNVLVRMTIGSSEYDHIHETDNNEEYQHSSFDGWHVMNGPTSEVWFEPWKAHLTKNGLKLHLNTELTKINYDGDKIISCVVKNKMGYRHVLANDYVLCINPFAAEKIFKQSNLSALYAQTKLLNEKTISQQISFRIGFGKKINFPIKNIAFVMTDSEFNITWYPQDSFWNTDLSFDDSIKSLWSGTIINAYTKGSIYGKNAIDLTKDEFINEITHQILRSKSFQKLILENNSFNLSKNDITYVEVWYEWNFNGQIMETHEKKWVNNIYNEEFRQSQRTDFNNLFIGGAHTKNSINVWSMEGAVESGKIISNLIAGDTYLFYHTDPYYVAPFQIFDNVLYASYLPNILDLFLITVLLFVILFVIKVFDSDCHPFRSQ